MVQRRAGTIMADAGASQHCREEEASENESVRTASLVRVYCSIDTSSSPVSSFLFLGAMVLVVLWDGARRGGDGACWWARVRKRQQTALGWGGGGVVYMTSRCFPA